MASGFYVLFKKDFPTLKIILKIEIFFYIFFKCIVTDSVPQGTESETEFSFLVIY